MVNELHQPDPPGAGFPRYPRRMNEIDAIDGPKARSPLPTGKSSEITGKNRAQPDPTAGSRSVKGRFLSGNKVVLERLIPGANGSRLHLSGC